MPLRRSDRRKPSAGRARLVAAATESLRQVGAHGTAIADVLVAAAAPSGVLYHHFPRGKADLLEAAVTTDGEATLAELESALAASASWRDALSRLVTVWSRRLVESDYSTGCAVSGAAADLQSAGTLQESCKAAYASWIDRLAAAIEADGVKPAEARASALCMIGAAEGALLLARAMRSIEPLEALERLIAPEQ
jgi:TetR/AcrR family transcriptional regulator, lmrAB and yxaGH operons repressor